MSPRAQIANMRHGFTYVELLAVIALSLVVIILVACWTIRARQAGGYTTCHSNLRLIGQAILLYGNDNKGAYTRNAIVHGQPQYGSGNCAVLDSPSAANDNILLPTEENQ